MAQRPGRQAGKRTTDSTWVWSPALAVFSLPPKVVVCWDTVCRDFTLTMNKKTKMALTAAHLNAGNDFGGK